MNYVYLSYLLLISTEEEKNKFEMLYETYKKIMFYKAFNILNNKQDAEDVVHQAFIKMIAILDKIGDPLCPKTRSLIVIITENKAIDMYRFKRRHNHAHFDEAFNDEASGPDPDKYSDSSIIAREIINLSPKYRQAILLKYDNGYSDAEIAMIMDMSLAAIQKNIQRAKKHLKDALAEEGVET